MSIKISTGLSKKIGQPDYGSLGASCTIEFELDGSVLRDDPTGFQTQIRKAYVACATAVEDELARHQGQTSASRYSTNNNGIHATSRGENNGHRHSGTGNGTSNGSPNGNGRKATKAQVRAILTIANRNRLPLDPILDRYSVHSVENLSIGEASAVIDELKSTRTGGRT